MANTTIKGPKKRTVYQLGTPFSTVEWPAVDDESQDTILELVCSLLRPWGQYQKSFGESSKGRKRRTPPNMAPTDTKSAACPEIWPYVDVGLANVTRRLQEQGAAASGQPGDEKTVVLDPYSIVIVALSGQSPAFSSHLPQLVAVSSQHLPPDEKPRLIGLSKPCTDRLGEVLGLPRVSAIGIRKNAPGSGALAQFARENVKPVGVRWLQEASEDRFINTNIKAAETTIGPKKSKLR